MPGTPCSFELSESWYPDVTGLEKSCHSEVFGYHKYYKYSGRKARTSKFSSLNAGNLKRAGKRYAEIQRVHVDSVAKYVILIAVFRCTEMSRLSYHTLGYSLEA